MDVVAILEFVERNHSADLEVHCHFTPADLLDRIV